MTVHKENNCVLVAYYIKNSTKQTITQPRPERNPFSSVPPRAARRARACPHSHREPRKSPRCAGLESKLAEALRGLKQCNRRLGDCE